MGFFERKKPPEPGKKPSPDELTQEQIAEDMKRYARQNPYRGNLHELDAEEARAEWKRTRFGGETGEHDATGIAPDVEGLARFGEQGAQPHAATARLPRALIRPCVEHPEERGVWSCVACGRNFCNRCVRPMMSFFNTNHGGYENRYGVCPACKDRCVDLEFEADKQKRVRVKAQQEVRSEGFRKAAYVFLAVQFVIAFIFKFPRVDLALDLQFILFMFGVVQYGPLRHLEIITKSFFVRALPGALMANGMSYWWCLVLEVQRDLFLGSGYLKKAEYWIAYALVGTPLKYVGIALLTFAGVMLIEKTADAVGHIYTGSQEATGWGRWDRASAILSIGIIIISLAYLLLSVLLT